MSGGTDEAEKPKLIGFSVLIGALVTLIKSFLSDSYDALFYLNLLKTRTRG